nr:acylneuraminate cytidylyltransferase family protein [uncultured Desulfobacter sp.]
MKIVCIIPARGGSKGIPDKNLQLLGNIPLVAFSIMTALSIPKIDRVIVSTDSPKIGSVAKEYGAEVPFLRPRALSADTSALEGVVAHCLRWLTEEDDYQPDICALMLPTHPFRRITTINTVLKRLSDRWGRVVTVRKVGVKKRCYFDAQTKNYRCLKTKSLSEGLHSAYRQYGLLDAFWVFPGTSFGTHYHIIDNDIELVDIDEWSDLHQARKIVDQGLYVQKAL